MDSFFDRSKKIANDLASRAKAAAQITAKQAERTKLATLVLPKAFAAFGKHIHALGKRNDDLAELHRQIDKLNERISAIESEAVNRLPPQRIIDKAKSAAITAKEAIQIKALQYQLRTQFVALGKGAFDSLGDAIDIKELTLPISDCKSRMAALDAEISNLASVPSGVIVTPKRIAITGVALAALFMVGGISQMMSGPGKRSSTVSSSPDKNSTPSTHVTSDGKKSDHIDWDERRTEIAYEHEDFDLERLVAKFGEPTEIFKEPGKPNCQLWGWQLGSAESDVWLVYGAVFRIDGGSGHIKLGEPQCVTKVRFERMQRAMTNAK